MPGGTNFPTSLDAFTNPNSAGGDTLASVPHDAQHGSANLAIEALEAKVGIDGSAVTTSFDYLIKKVLGTPVVREVPAGSMNGSNVTFTLAHTPIAGSEEIYRNGVLQDSTGGSDYTISSATITMAAAPASGDVLLASYRY